MRRLALPIVGAEMDVKSAELFLAVIKEAVS